MKKEVKEIIEVPEGINVDIKDKTISLKKDSLEFSRRFEGFDAKQENHNILLYNDKATKNEKKLIKSLAAHLRNSIRGMKEEYTYQLRICFVHFPITVELKENSLLIKNFLGEKTPRKAKIVPGVKVKIDKDLITLSSFDKEKVGQTAANIETASKVRNRDRRVFQDGIFMIKKSKGRAP